MRSRRLAGQCLPAVVLLIVGSWAAPTAAQKVPGTTLAPTTPATGAPAASAPRPVQPARPAPSASLANAPPARAEAAPGAEQDAEARQLAGQLPLDPSTANLVGRMPADVPGTVNRLGLRVPNGTATDLRNRPTTREAVIDALRH